MNLKGYRVILSKRARKSLNKVDKKNTNAILYKLKLLVTDDMGLDVKKIIDSKRDLYRLRSGDYRIIYTVYKKQIVVLVVDVGHRREIYKNLVR